MEIVILSAEQGRPRETEGVGLGLCRKWKDLEKNDGLIIDTVAEEKRRPTDGLLFIGLKSMCSSSKI